MDTNIERRKTNAHKPRMRFNQRDHIWYVQGLGAVGYAADPELAYYCWKEALCRHTT